MTPTSMQDMSFLQKVTAVKVTFGNLPFSKKLPKASVQDLSAAPDRDSDDDQRPSGIFTASDVKRVSASKKLWNCKEAEAIKTEFSRLRGFVVERTLPSPLGKGVYFVPNTRLAEVDAELVMAQQVNIPRLADSLIAVFAQVLEREAVELGPNFAAADYDTPEGIRQRLKVDFQYMTFGIPENLPDAIRMREAEKQGQRLMESVEAIQQLLRAEMAELVTHAVDKLTGKRDDGKPQVFRNSLLTNLRDFLDLFRDRNITNDAEMEELCARAAKLIEGVDPESLRSKEPLRESVAKGFADIKAALDTMLVPKGSRSILFEEEDAPAEAETVAA